MPSAAAALLRRRSKQANLTGFFALIDQAAGGGELHGVIGPDRVKIGVRAGKFDDSLAYVKDNKIRPLGGQRIPGLVQRRLVGRDHSGTPREGGMKLGPGNSADRHHLGLPRFTMRDFAAVLDDIELYKRRSIQEKYHPRSRRTMSEIA